ncbi:hypothetical protein OOK31_35035 [Streptomyces sp. NBC_00249]|uniref:hypothetical protein n=1 Tax=Streptomyces sp. NBC_00249 TaxID=2975690 RepID=UPI002259C3BE|nr:hypothetical protein [Streptomyces sp. NBC_00249]MCX5199043.1 hypothetical protein [Streptomyces sp. NBC_00249]
MDFTVIANAVEVDDGVKRVSMRFIKKYAAPGRARLSPELCEKITAALDTQGLITVPRTLPTSENEFIFVIEKDSPLGQAVKFATIGAQLDKAGLPLIPHFRDNFPAAKTHYL